ncbi:MAG: VWA domain-containing protein [Acidobacteriota bacterium]|nr:VWA domain-containing protein [Blastocatellia bacterium]MDW8412858.1 VWA domain-containing protein [Acidobacteriota bacterium]
MRALLILSLLAQTIFAQDEEAVVRISTSLINLPVTVLNDKGKFVVNLKRENFRVYENGRQQQIIQFESQTNMPLSVVILMDTSTSVRNRLEFEKAAIKSFLSSVLQSRRDRVAFVTFDTDIKLVVDFTEDLEKISKAVDDIKSASGQTSFYDAVAMVCREKMTRTGPRRRVIVAITDGADTNSKTSLDKAIALAQKTETTIYGISTKGGAAFRVEGTSYLNADDRDLKKLCFDTGGDVLFPKNPEELNRAFQIVTDFLRNQYLIVYEPDSVADGRYHAIEVKITGAKNLTAITRKGYFAQ